VTAHFVAAVAVFLVLPFLFFREETLRKYIALEAVSYAFAALVWRQVEAIDPYLAAVALFAAKLIVFSLFLARGREVRWSANHAAVAALLIYALLIPAMQRPAIDGDEPYYLLITESLVRDFDLDLANQYAQLGQSATGRVDLHPQLGDRVGPRGEQYSRLEPLLPALLIPGYLVAGRSGAIAIVVLFGVLLVRSTVRWLEDEGIEAATARAVFPFFAFAPPIVFFTARLWPEVPAAFLFVEALRGVRNRRAPKWIVATVALAALKVRFVLVAVPVVMQAVIRNRRVASAATAGLIVLVVTIGAATGRLGLSTEPGRYVTGFFGLLLDGAAGITLQAPFFLLGIFALTAWRRTPEGFRTGIVTTLLYLACLVPRSEWHGGWSPPLRYVVFLMPVLALGAASVWSRVAPPIGALLAVWTAALAVHGVAHPWRLFRIANGENAAGEWLSTLYHSDFSRLFPSFIRVNSAATVGAIVLLGLCVAAGFSLRFNGLKLAAPLLIPAISLALAFFYLFGRTPGQVIHFEDAHVVRTGGELHPPPYTVARFLFRGGWMLHGGNSVSFLARPRTATLYYAAREPAVIRLGSRVYRLPATADQYRAVPVVIEVEGRSELQCISGSVNLDKIE
jgi:hypothetical protein